MEEKDGLIVKPSNVIKCPHCGWEYLAGEILIPTEVVGRPSRTVVRDPLGHILYAEYEEDEEPVEQEQFTCYNCDKPFVIKIETKYSTEKEQEELDFSEDYVSLL